MRVKTYINIGLIFTIGDIQKQVGMCDLDGIAPSPRTDVKSKVQNEDKVNGSSLCKKIFVP